MAVFPPLKLNNIGVVIIINGKDIDPQSANIEFFLYTDKSVGRSSIIKKVPDGLFGYPLHNILHSRLIMHNLLYEPPNGQPSAAPAHPHPVGCIPNRKRAGVRWRAWLGFVFVSGLSSLLILLASLLPLQPALRTLYAPWL